MNKYITSFLLAAVFSFVFMSCGDKMNSLGSKPIAMGRINSPVILCDKTLQESNLGDTIQYYFQAAYPVLPAEEPIFDIRFMSPADLNAEPLRRELRTFVIISDISDTTSSTTKMVRMDLGEERFSRALTDTSFTTSIGNDKWARDQIIIYIFANGKERLANAIANNFPTIANRINKHDVKNLSATVFGIQNENKLLSAEILAKFGLNITIPGLFNKAKDGENFLWLRMDNKVVNQSLVFRKFEYKDKSQFSKESIIKMRNDYGKEFIQTGFKDAYMSTNVIDLPIYEYSYTNNGVYVKEVRGIWETVNDFMGGPYVSYVLHNEAKGEIVFIDAFVFAPGKNKRDFVQQLDCIVKTGSFPGKVKG